MALLGVNVAGRAQQSPSDIAALGARWARCVAYPDTNIIAWVQGCHAKGVKVLLVLARESIGSDPRLWAGNIAMFRDRYGSLVDAYQLGNEADHVSPSSWDMTQAELSQLLRTGRNVLGPDAYLIGAGMVSGHPDWGATVDWSPVQALAAHPYAKSPGTPALDILIDGYAAYGRAVWVTEYHARTIGMAAALRDDPRLTVALAFCYSDSMVPGFGMLEDANALADFKAAAKAGGLPTSQHPAFVLGFKAFYDAAKDLIGPALEPERGGVPGLSFQRSQNGFLTWADLKQGQVMTFYEDATRRRWRWQEGWESPVEL